PEQLFHQGKDKNFIPWNITFVQYSDRMNFKVSSITTKLLLLFMFVGLASVALVGIYSFYAAREAIIKRTMDQLVSVRAVKKQQIEYFFVEKIRSLGFLSLSHDIELLANDTAGPGHQDRKARLIAMENIQSYGRSYGFSRLFLAYNHKGNPAVLALGEVGSGAWPSAEHAKFIQLWKSMEQGDTLVIIDLFRRSADDSVPVCMMGKGIRDDQGRLKGAVILEVSSAEINRIMLQNNSRIGLGQSGESYLVGHDLQMRSESRFIPHSVLVTEVRSLSAKKAIANQTGAIGTSDYRNIKVFSAYEPLDIPGLRWIILAEIDYEESLIPVNRIRNDILLVSLIISIFILAIARLISKMITQPIIRLKDAALKTGQGDFDSRVDVRSTDEIGALAGTFNTMIDRIREERERRLSAMYDGQEMERQRVSRELHDGLGQKLVGAKLQLENCDGQDFQCLQKTFGEIRNVFGSLIEETRQISNDLMPSALHELGLANALENLCNTAGHQANLEIEFYTHGYNEPTDNKTTVYLYRIAQEALNNAIRHSGAQDISMQLIENKENLILILEDNGMGFIDIKGEPGSGNGLYNMQERARILGGTINIETSEGKGTTIRVKIPKHK
ncbi:MAG: HAMP domain-containing protein, partial [Bacteroidetes bacterium]|nr:HAMP domain-containing protein [Bacteroidota bacterium]